MLNYFKIYYKKILFLIFSCFLFHAFIVNKQAGKNERWWCTYKINQTFNNKELRDKRVVKRKHYRHYHHVQKWCIISIQNRSRVLRVMCKIMCIDRYLFQIEINLSSFWSVWTIATLLVSLKWKMLIANYNLESIKFINQSPFPLEIYALTNFINRFYRQ